MATISGSKVATEHCLPISHGAGVPDGLPPFWRLARELEPDSSVRSTPKPVSRSTSAARPQRSLRTCQLTGSNSTYCSRKALSRTERQIPAASN